MWIARDKDGLIHIYKKKPIKTGYGWFSNGWIIPAPSYDFTEVKWEDKEPRELILKPIKEEYGFVNLYKDGSQMKVGWKIFPTK